MAKTFQQRVELRINTVLIALDRLARVSNAENVVSGAQKAKLESAINAGVKECYATVASKDRAASGFKF